MAKPPATVTWPAGTKFLTLFGFNDEAPTHHHTPAYDTEAAAKAHVDSVIALGNWEAGFVVPIVYSVVK